MDKDVFKNLPALKTIQVNGNVRNQLPEVFLNRTHTVNVSIERKHENVHCEFHKKPREQCFQSSYPVCAEAMDIKEDLEKRSPFPKHACVLATCENKQRKVKLVCMASSSMANNTCLPGMIGENTGVKLALWTFGLLAVASNLLVLLTLLCNSEVRSTPLCIFVMNLLFGNILIGAHIVIVTVSDTVTYGDSSECHQESWDGKLCVPLFIIKYIGLIIVILSLVLVTIERFLVVIVKSTRRFGVCRAIGYVFESWIFATIATVVLWTKADKWGYLCSTFSSGKSFMDFNKGINLALLGICVMLICLHLFMICRTKLKKPVIAVTVEYRNAVRMFLVVLSTFFAWAVPYTLFLFTVPEIFTETIAMQTMAISLSVNACLHAFLYAFDNDHLENLYSALSCRKEDSNESSLKTEKAKDANTDIEMGQMPAKKSLESLTIVEAKEDKENSATVLTVSEQQQRADTQRRGSELSRAEGAVIIRNKSPTGSRQEEAIVLVHSTPSSPITSTRCGRAHDEGVSECGTISSDTNVTWLSSECPSMSPSSPNALLKINDGNSTLSSDVSSITPSKSASNAGSLQKPKRRADYIEKESKRQRLSKECVGSSLNQCDGEEIKCDMTKDENQNTKRDRRMSPVRDIIVRVLSPKAKKRPKTLDCVPTAIDGTKNPMHSPHKRTKSLLEGKDAEILRSDYGNRSPLRPLSPVRLRAKKPKDGSKEKRNGVLVFRAGSDGLEIHEDVTSPTSPRSAMCTEQSEKPETRSPKAPNKSTDWERLATFLVIKPVSPKSKIKISDKDKRKGRHSLPEAVLKGPERVRIYENPAINFDSEAESSPKPTSPTSPTRRLAKLEEGDKLTELPIGLKQKNRISTASTVSRVSKSSLEWDPSCAYEYGDEEVMPPPPPPPPQPIPDLPPTPQPSPGPERKAESSDQVECVQVRLDPANRYSLEWDPTGVQMRLSVISQDSVSDGNKSVTSARKKAEPEYV